MKILFIQNFFQEYLGVMSISAILKDAGHEVDLLIVNKESEIIEKVKSSTPDIIGFSSTTGMYSLNLRQSKLIKDNFDVPIIFGGVHPTICPEIINEPSIDMICIGEGEYAALELLNKMAAKQLIYDIKNLWIKVDGQVYKNELRPLFAEIDKISFFDRELYYSRYPDLRNKPTKAIIIGRGCPYHCNYCINDTLMNQYQGNGPYVRKRSIANIIDEIVQVRDKYGLESVYFDDDTFTLYKEWLIEFLTEYVLKVNLPFTCSSRADLLNEEMVTLLAKAQCKCIEIGVESGDEEIRLKVLNKTIKDEDIIEAAKLMKKYGIKVKTSNMMCLPGETLEKAIKTVKLNAKIKADASNCSLLQPYPKLGITQYAIDNGYLDANFDFTTLGYMSYNDSPIKLKDGKKIKNLQKLYYIGIWFPQTIPLLIILVNLPENNILFTSIFKITHAISYARYHQLRLSEVIKLGLKSRKFFIKPL